MNLYISSPVSKSFDQLPGETKEDCHNLVDMNYLTNTMPFEEFRMEQHSNFDTLSQDITRSSEQTRQTAKTPATPKRIAATRKSRTRHWPARSSEPPVFTSLMDYQNNILDPNPIEIQPGTDSGRNLLAIFEDQPGREPRLAYNVRVKNGRSKQLWPNFKGVKEADMPCGMTLKQVCQFFPLHVWGDGIRIFMAEGWTAEDIWRAIPAEARNEGAATRPWNYLQQAMGREADKMYEEAGNNKRVPVKRKRDDADDNSGEQRLTPALSNEDIAVDAEFFGVGLPDYGTPVSLKSSLSTSYVPYATTPENSIYQCAPLAPHGVSHHILPQIVTNEYPQPKRQRVDTTPLAKQSGWYQTWSPSSNLQTSVQVPREPELQPYTFHGPQLSQIPTSSQVQKHPVVTPKPKGRRQQKPVPVTRSVLNTPQQTSPGTVENAYGSDVTFDADSATVNHPREAIVPDLVDPAILSQNDNFSGLHTENIQTRTVSKDNNQQTINDIQDFSLTLPFDPTFGLGLNVDIPDLGDFDASAFEGDYSLMDNVNGFDDQFFTMHGHQEEPFITASGENDIYSMMLPAMYDESSPDGSSWAWSSEFDQSVSPQS